MIEKKDKSKKKVDPNVEKDIKVKLLQGVPATKLIKDHGYARSTVYKVRQELIDDWEKSSATPLPSASISTGFNQGEITVPGIATTEPIAYATASTGLEIPAHNIFYLMFAELQRMNRELVQIGNAVNLMNVNNQAITNMQADIWNRSKTDEQSSSHSIIRDPDAMKKNVAVVMRNMIPDDILKSMPPHLRKAYDGLLGTLAAPNDPVWNDDNESNKPDPREPAAPDRSTMDPFTRLGDTLDRVTKGLTGVDDILYGNKRKDKSKLKKSDLNLTTPVNPICPGCQKDTPPIQTSDIPLTVTSEGQAWHKECFHKHLESQQQKAEDEINKE